MHLSIRRFAIAAPCVVGVLAVSAAPALASGVPIATTQAATNITATSAILHGTVNPNGSTTGWQFLYGTSLANAKTAPVQAGSLGPVTTPVAVSEQVKNLTPNTTYAFAPIATNANNIVTAYYYYGSGLFSSGVPLTFRTAKAPAGKGMLSTLKFKVSGKTLKIGFKCASAFACNGHLTLTSRGKIRKRRKNWTCVNRKSFSFRPGRSGTIKTNVTGNCVTLLKHARHHRIGGKLTLTFTTGQPKLNRNVTLTRS